MSIDGMSQKEYRMQLIKELIDIVTELQWNVGIPEGEEDEEVPGLIIGTPEYVDRVTEAVEEYENPKV